MRPSRPFRFPLARAIAACALFLLCLPAAAAQVLLVFGDSLSAAYGLATTEGWVHLLAERARKDGLDWRIVNASISGETTAGGLRRLPAELDRHKPAVVLIALGANDALRGQPVAAMRANLERMIRLARGAGAEPVLAGMMIPPNYGIDYAAQFQALYGALAREHKVPLVPFLLEGVADKPELFQADQLHPGAKAQERIAGNVWPVIEPLLRRRRAP